MKILVTGCSGFIGSALIDCLLKQEHNIFCISRADSCSNASKTKHLQHDLSKQLNYNMLPTNLDYIVHLAATMKKAVKDYDMFQTNAICTLNLLEYGREISTKKFIFASSGAVYGYCKNPLSEESPINPVNFYGLSKYQSELLVNHYNQHFSTVILRLFFPYGPKQVRGIIPQLTNKIKNKRPIIVFNNGNPKINPIYITDVIDSINRSLPLEGQHAFNICGDEATTMKDLSLLIGTYLGIEPIFTYINDKRIADLTCDNALMKKYLRITPKISVKQGIKNYLKDSGSLKR